MSYYRKMCREPKYVTINCIYCFLLFSFHPFIFFSCPFSYDLSYVIICDYFLLQDSLLSFLCFYTSYIHLNLFLPTYLHTYKCLFYVTKFSKKYFEGCQDVIKLPFTLTQTKIDFSYQANEKTLQSFSTAGKD